MNCHKCIHHRTIPGDAHIACTNYNTTPIVYDKAPPRYVYWPLNFDPVWIKECKGFSDDLKNKKQEEPNEVLTILSILARRLK